MTDRYWAVKVYGEKSGKALGYISDGYGGPLLCKSEALAEERMRGCAELFKTKLSNYRAVEVQITEVSDDSKI